MSNAGKPNNPDFEGAPIEGEDETYANEEAKRREAEADLDVPIMNELKGSAGTPVVPVRLSGGNSFCFKCHPGVSCWNECCHDTDITLTPYDLIRLSRYLDMRPGDVGRFFGTPGLHEASSMPVLKLKRVDRGEGQKKPCVFLDEVNGCSVYKDRPAACRYYPLGLASVKMKGQDAPEDFYFLVKEPHCKGHDETQEQTVSEYRADQGVEDYDKHNRGWIHCLMKLASWKSMGGPWGKELDDRTRKMFFMATTDLDAFRRFVFDTSFLDKYEIAAEMRPELATDDEILLKLALDWLRSILFNEPMVSLKEHVLHQAIAKARNEIGGT